MLEDRGALSKKTETCSIKTKPCTDGSKEQEHQRNTGSGREESRTLCESHWEMNHCSVRKWESERIRAGVSQREAFRITFPRMVHSWELQGNGERVDGQWCGWITMKSLGPMHGINGTLEAEFEVQRTIKRKNFRPDQNWSCHQWFRKGGFRDLLLINTAGTTELRKCGK